jgi:histidinol-phosphate aminotransferase
MTDPLRPAIRAMPGYTPGEQPRDGEYLKLNTNENPYPPSPRVVEAIRAALTGDKLRKYPDPVGRDFRATAGRVLGVDPDAILIGNGSDEILTLLTRAFVPEGGLVVAPTPSYILYRTLADVQGARYAEVPFTADWTLDRRGLPAGAHLTFLPNPNSPTGTQIPPAELADWPTPLVLDEAYVDFAATNGLGLVRESDRVVVTRTLSKSYALAGIRFGFAVGRPEVIRQLYKVKDSYNCDVLSLAAATAALADQEHLHATRAKILATRARLTAALRGLGFDALDSQANFVWCRHPRPVQPVYEELKRRKILVRFMRYEGYGEGLRITVGTDAEIDRLLDELRQLV